MTKRTSFAKNLGGGLKTVLGDSETIRQETNIPDNVRPMRRTDNLEADLANSDITEQFHRITLVMEDKLHEKLKQLAYFERDLLKNVTNKIIQNAIDAHEEKHGKLPEIPMDKQPAKKVHKPKSKK